jgi:hypothetical protein
MQIRLAYGKSGLDIELPAHWKAVVLEPRFTPGLSNPFQSISQALRQSHKFYFHEGLGKDGR